MRTMTTVVTAGCALILALPISAQQEKAKPKTSKKAAEKPVAEKPPAEKPIAERDAEAAKQLAEARRVFEVSFKDLRPNPLRVDNVVEEIVGGKAFHDVGFPIAVGGGISRFRISNVNGTIVFGNATTTPSPLLAGDYKKALESLDKARNKMTSAREVDDAMKALDEGMKALMEARAALWKQRDAQEKKPDEKAPELAPPARKREAK